MRRKKKTMVRCVNLKWKIKVLNNNKTILEFNNLEVGYAFSMYLKKNLEHVSIIQYLILKNNWWG
jgi:hypothetical protein